MPFAHVNGQKLYYEDTGGEGPVIVFSHGLLMDGSMFAPQVEALRSTWRCITWDERGHGQTADLARCDPFTYYDSANDLAALLGHLGVRQADDAIVQTILGMARNLELEIVAEGVETEAQRDFLALHGCDLYQGYLFGRPMPVDELEALAAPEMAVDL